MSIWKIDPSLDDIAAMSENTAVAHNGIEVIERGDDFLRGRMQVTANHVQPYRTLHGGVSCVLAESLGSYASFFCCESGCISVGQAITANHIRAVRQGEWVYATARPLHLGRRTHVWAITLENEAGQLVCDCRLTCAIIAK